MSTPRDAWTIRLAAAVSVRRAMADIVLDPLERFFRGERVATRVTPRMLERTT